MSDSTVWIIVPVYNAEKTLKTCIDSLVKQTYRNIKIILVDDGSKDKSGKICDECEKKDSRITVIHKMNGGSNSARIAGVAVLPADGYCIFCDSDDYLPPDGIEKLYGLVAENNADLACGISQRILPNGRKIKSLHIPDSLKNFRVYEKADIETILMRSFFGITDFPGYMHTKIYKNALLKKSIDFEFPVKFFQEDIAFNLQFLYGVQRLAVKPEIVYFYRMGGGTAKFMPTFLEDCINLYEFKLRQIELKSFPEDYVYTSAVEMKNELYSWLYMFYNKYKGDENKIRAEIKRCCNLAPIIGAVNYPKEDTSGVAGFRELVKSKDVNGIYTLLNKQEKKNRLKTIIKRLVFGK